MCYFLAKTQCNFLKLASRSHYKNTPFGVPFEAVFVGLSVQESKSLVLEDPLKAVEKMKIDLWNKKKNNGLTQIEEKQLDFFRKRGSTFLMTAAIAGCLEIFLNRQIPNLFNRAFQGNPSPQEAIDKWSPIVEVSSSFAFYLVDGLADGFKTRETVHKAVSTFQSFISATGEANAVIYSDFADMVVYETS